MPGPGSAGLFASLRGAARLTQERFLVGVADAAERARVVAALSAEGVVVELSSAEQALDRLAEEPFELAVLDEGGVDAQRDPFATARELRPFADVVLLLGGDPERWLRFLRARGGRLAHAAPAGKRCAFPRPSALAGLVPAGAYARTAAGQRHHQPSR